ncbi:MAG: rhodanese-like domain-containing protein [Synergistaceae bacterium]|nr:rhodanese-like domain-containing protein [Synergistaceae bacterium]
MKKFLVMTLAASLIMGATASVAATNDGAGDGSSASDSILAQVQANKEANKNKTADKAPETKPEEKAPAESAPANKESADKENKENPATAVLDQIAKEEAEKAAKESEASPNNRGVVDAPAQQNAPQPAEPTTAAPAQPVQQQPAQPQPVQIPSDTETKAPQPVAAPVQPQPAGGGAELPAGRPISPSPMAPGEAETPDSLIVTVDWLKANISKVILVDSRPDSLYAGGHIPGAVNAPWTYFANVNTKQGTEKWGVVWPAATMAKRLGALGINGSKTVVAYCDAGGWGQSGWTVWVLRQAGIKNAKMLEGGIGAWRSAGGKVVKDKHTNKAAAFKLDKYAPNYVVATEWINDNMGKPGLAIVDVRTEPEFLGKIRPFQEKRAGHLPGALNISREEFVTQDGKFKTPDEVRSLMASRGITPDNEIVVYDTAGVRSAFVTMLLRYAGFLKSQNYDAGFQAWAGNPELPLVKP